MKVPAHVDERALFARLTRFEIETPSWGYADTVTRFSKFLQDAPASTIEEKLADAAPVHKYTGCCPALAVHVPSVFTPRTGARNVARPTQQLGVWIEAINPNVIQDQCYKWGSVGNRDPEIRWRACSRKGEEAESCRPIRCWRSVRAGTRGERGRSAVGGMTDTGSSYA